MPEGSDYTDQLLSNGDNHDQNSAGRCFAEMGNARFAVTKLNFEINGIVGDDLLGFFGGNIVPGDMANIGGIP